MKKLICMSFEENMWKNVHLMKDCGLVPYYFHKIYGYEAVMVGANVDNYTYLDTYLKGLKMEFLDEDSNEARLKYVMDNSTEIDILMMIGPYHINHECAKVYKRLNPKGKILLQLDMNSNYGEWIEDAINYTGIDYRNINTDDKTTIYILKVNKPAEGFMTDTDREINELERLCNSNEPNKEIINKTIYRVNELLKQAVDDGDYELKIKLIDIRQGLINSKIL